MAHVIELTRFTLEIVEDPLALLRLPPDQIRSQHERGTEGRGGSHPVRHVFASQPSLGEYPHGVLGEPGAASLAVVERADGAAPRRDEIGHIELKHVHFHSADAAHAFLMQ